MKVNSNPVYDASGSEKFISLIPSYITASSIAVIFYDVTQKMSFDNVNKWYDHVIDAKGKESRIIIIGNKIDLESERFFFIFIYFF